MGQTGGADGNPVSAVVFRVPMTSFGTLWQRERINIAFFSAVIVWGCYNAIRMQTLHFMLWVVIPAVFAIAYSCRELSTTVTITGTHLGISKWHSKMLFSWDEVEGVKVKFSPFYGYSVRFYTKQRYLSLTNSIGDFSGMVSEIRHKLDEKFKCSTAQYCCDECGAVAQATHAHCAICGSWFDDE